MSHISGILKELKQMNSDLRKLKQEVKDISEECATALAKIETHTHKEPSQNRKAKQ